MEPDGKILLISVDNMGAGITVHEVVPSYQIGGTMLDLKGPDAWRSLDDLFPKYTLVPPHVITSSSVEAHVNVVRDPIWFKAVQNIINIHKKSMQNPYIKK